MSTVAPANTNWRDAMTREDRTKVCQHIMEKLAPYFIALSEKELKEKSSTFESEAFTNAESRVDYLRRVAGGLSNVERQFTAKTTTASM